MGILILTDAGRDEYGAVCEIGKASNAKVRNAIEVGSTARNEIWTRLADEILGAAGDEPGRGERQGQTEPASMPLPEFPLPDGHARGCLGTRRAGHDNEADDGDDDGGGDKGGDEEDPQRDGLGGLGKGNGEIREGKGTFGGLNVAQDGRDTGNDNE